MKINFVSYEVFCDTVFGTDQRNENDETRQNGFKFQSELYSQTNTDFRVSNRI